MENSVEHVPRSGTPEYAETATILLAKFQDHKSWARHHEEQRATLTNIFVITAGGVLSLATYEHIGGRVPVGTFLLILGFLGALMTRKHVERFAYHSEWARRFDEKIRALAPYTNIANAEGHEETYRKRMGPIVDLSLSWLWISIHVGIALIGILLLFKPLVASVSYW